MGDWIETILLVLVGVLAGSLGLRPLLIVLLYTAVLIVHGTIK